MRIEESIVIDQSPEEVFTFLEARSNDSRWMEVVRSSDWVDATAPMGVGRRGRMVMKSMSDDVEYLDEVTEYEAGRRIAHRSVSGPVELKTACICEPSVGGSRVTVVAEADDLAQLAVRNVVLRKLAGPLFVSLIRRGFRADLRRLKAILEAPVEASR